MCVVSFELFAHVDCLGSVLKCGRRKERHDYPVLFCGYVSTPAIIEGFYDQCATLLVNWLLSFYGPTKSVSGGQFPEVGYNKHWNKHVGYFSLFPMRHAYIPRFFVPDLDPKQKFLLLFSSLLDSYHDIVVVFH